MSVLEKLQTVQQKIKAPKGQFNKFGGFHYRSCEDIVEAVKPILSEVGAVIILNDTIRTFGDVLCCDAEATFIDMVDGGNIKVGASAGIDIHRKGMDIAQSFGASSSYARKYALQGLLLLDDGSDPDSSEKGLALVASNGVTARETLQDYTEEARRLDAERNLTTEQKRKEMTDWFIKRYGSDAMLKFHEMTGGVFSAPDKIRTDKNVGVCYNKYLEYKEANNA